MLTSKKETLTFLQILEEKLSTVEVTNEIQDKYKPFVSDLEMIVPVIGGFSAGKSTLINSFIDNNILPTAITPETSLPTELRYSPTNYIEAVKLDGTVQNFEVEQMEQVKDLAESLQCAKLYLNNQTLKKIAPMVLVDMPGFDSPVEAHHESITRYIGKSCHFIVLTSCEDGNITRSILKQLHQFVDLGLSFDFFLTKKDLKPASEIEEISTYMKDQIADELDLEQNVLAVDNTSGQALANVLEAIDLNQLFKKICTPHIKSVGYDALGAINTKKSTFERDQGTSEKAIRDLKSKIEELNTQSEELKKDLSSKYSIPSICRSISNACQNELNRKLDTFTELAINNTNQLTTEIQETIKYTLSSEIHTQMARINEQVINEVTNSIQSLDQSLANTSLNLDGTMIDSLSGLIKEKLTNGTQAICDLVGNLAKKKDAGKLITTIATVLGVTTAVLAPAVEIVIIFLPTIIQAFSESRQKQQIREKLANQIIPNTISQIANKLPSLIEEQVAVIVQGAYQVTKEELDKQQENIESALVEKAEFQGEIEKEITKLQSIYKTIQDNLKNILA